ncbi:MAG: site-specific DNA-methyltransferase [Dethiobacter sp.]
MSDYKMKFETPNLTAENVAKIAELFPGVVTEGKVNIDLLRTMLGEDVYGDEAYEFTWVGKRAAIAEVGRPIRKTLRPCVEESRDWDTTENLYIEGDNLDVLKLLQESYLGKVKMVYIDPPYNTGNDFVYRDNFTASREEYEEEAGVFDEDGDRLFKNTETNGRFHSDWCSMIYPRLVLARNMLRDDGVIFISIDYNENANLRTIMDEVFGMSNFVGEIYWESKTKSQNTTTSYNKLQPKAEMILVYTKQSKRRFNLMNRGSKEYPLSDEQGEYREYPLEVMNATGIRGRESMIYDVSDGVSTVSPATGKQWQFGLAQVATYKKGGNLFIRDGRVIIKMRPEFERSESTEPFWGLFPKGMGTTESAKKELTEILGQHGFETVKPVDVIKRLTLHATEDNDIVLDFFSGSATTAHAVMQLNAEDGGKRKFIMVQLPEVCAEGTEAYKAGYKNICEIGKERIRRAGDKIKIEAGLTAQNLDIGFRVLKLDDTNMNDVYYAASDYTQDLVSMMESNIKPDRTDLDLLYGCLLDWGLPLSMPHTHEKIDGFTVHTYNDGDLIACFEERISEKAIREIASRKPLRAVFRDSGFTSSPEKINVFEIFKLLAPSTNVRVI